MKIKSPIEGYNGITELGPHRLEFKDGVAEVDDLNDGAKRWLRKHGYGVGSTSPTVREADPVQPADPREVATQRVGTPIRDGAVDPRPGDFLGPTNAGEANPHGTEVVNPGIHGDQGTRPVKPGDVHVDDPDAQDAAETAHTEGATGGTPIDDAKRDPRPGDGDGSQQAPTPEADVELKGEALEAALEERGLPKSGTADDKRARVAEHDAASKGQA